MSCGTSAAVLSSRQTRGSPFDRICYIGPQKKGYGNIGFFFGAGLLDPKHLLVGERKRLKQTHRRDLEGSIRVSCDDSQEEHV
jgi:hypothetical protein